MHHHRMILIAGTAAAVAAMLWTLFEFAMGWHNARADVGATTGFVATLFPLVAILWAIARRRSAQGGLLTWPQAMATGLGVSLVNGALGVAFFALYYTRINPAFVAEMAARGHPVDVPTQLVAVAAGSLLFGAVVSGLAGLAMRRGGGSVR